MTRLKVKLPVVLLSSAEQQQQQQPQQQQQRHSTVSRFTALIYSGWSLSLLRLESCRVSEGGKEGEARVEESGTQGSNELMLGSGLVAGCSVSASGLNLI